MTIDEMRDALGLGPEVEAIDVVTQYVDSLDGEDPPAPLITLDEVKAHLKILSSDEDDLIQGYIDAAIGDLEGPDGSLRRTLTPKTITARLDYLPSGPFKLPLPPIRSIVAIEVKTAAGWTVVDDTSWTFEDDAIELEPGYAWPTPIARSRGVRVIYEAGYDLLPKPIRSAILLMVGDLYMNRETTVPTANATKVPMSTTVDLLLERLRVYR